MRLVYTFHLGKLFGYLVMPISFVGLPLSHLSIFHASHYFLFPWSRNFPGHTMCSPLYSYTLSCGRMEWPTRWANLVELSCISSDSFILFELLLEVKPSLEFNNRLNLYLFPIGKAHGSSNASATRWLAWYLEIGSIRTIS